MADIQKVPTLKDLKELVDDPAEAFKQDVFKFLVNNKPPETWLKKNKLANNSTYLPIDKTEYLLDMICKEWKVEVLSVGTMFHSVYVTVRVHYKNPINGIWYFHDGVGAKVLQRDANTVFSVETIKNAAVEMALPIAKSMAIKDACDHIGKIFGRDVNRKDTLDYQMTHQDPDMKKNYPDKSEERLLQLIANAKDRVALEKLAKDIESNEARVAYDQRWEELKPGK